MFVRMIQSAPRKTRRASRTSARSSSTSIEKLGGGWIAIEVAFYNNGERVQMEEYADVKADPVLEPGLFEPGPWKPRPGWSYRRCVRRTENCMRRGGC